MNHKLIGKNIRLLREEKGYLTQEEFAIVAGIHVRTLQRAEGGEKVAFQTLKDIANALQATPDDLANAQPVLLHPGGVSSWPRGYTSPITYEGCRELDNIQSKAGSDWRSLHNEHVQPCPKCRDRKTSLYIDWRGFDDCKEMIEEWVVNAGLIDLKHALHFEDTLSLENVLSQEQILAINARFREAEHQWASADDEAIAGIWEALDRDFGEILEHTEYQKQRAPY